VVAWYLREIWTSELTTEEKLQLAIPMTNWMEANAPKAADQPQPGLAAQ
jgi:hypothetical protein